MGKGGGNAPSPDPQIGAAALKQANLGEQWLSFAKDSYKTATARQGELDKLTKRVTEQQLGIGDMSMANAKADRARYEAKGIPAQDAFAKEALSYSTPERQAEAAAEARTGVQTEAAAARAQADRESASMGIKPGSGRYAGIKRAGELGTAAATAGAGNQARTAMRDKGLALKADVANMYAGLPAQSGNAAQVALAAGSGAVGMNQNNQQISNSNASHMVQGFGGAMGGYASQASTLLNQYGLQLDAWKAQQEQKSANMQGLFSAIGTIGGAAIGLSSRKAKQGVKKVKTGDGLKAVKGMPVSTYKYKPGYADGGAKDHIGTMADKYAKARGVPDTGTIDLQDAIGVTMKAVQDLDHKVSKMDRALGGKKGPAKAKAKKPTPAPRRSSQSPAKARAVKLTTVKPGATAQSYGIRRA